MDSTAPSSADSMRSFTQIATVAHCFLATHQACTGEPSSHILTDLSIHLPSKIRVFQHEHARFRPEPRVVMTSSITLFPTQIQKTPHIDYFFNSHMIISSSEIAVSREKGKGITILCPGLRRTHSTPYIIRTGTSSTFNIDSHTLP